MATLVNKLNREVKVIIPNMREFRTFYSDNEGVIGMFFKRDWEEEKQDSHWEPSDEQMEQLENAMMLPEFGPMVTTKKQYPALESLYSDLKKLM